MPIMISEEGFQRGGFSKIVLNVLTWLIHEDKWNYGWNIQTNIIYCEMSRN